jgi:hypothetical protein
MWVEEASKSEGQARIGLRDPHRKVAYLVKAAFSNLEADQLGCLWWYGSLLRSGRRPPPLEPHSSQLSLLYWLVMVAVPATFFNSVAHKRGCLRLLGRRLRMIRAARRETSTYSSQGGKEPDGSPTYLGLGLSGGPTHPNREYAGIREKQHLTMPMTDWILTYQWVPEEIAMIATVSVSKRCDKVFESLCNVLIKCLVARLKPMIVSYVPHHDVK